LKDLSKLVDDGWPAYGASMAGGNTVTSPPNPDGALHPAPGSTSESTADIIMTHLPNLEIPSDQHVKPGMNLDGIPHPEHKWKKIN